MTKEAYYFPHDSNAQDDPKCMLLIDQMGMEGYGIFWALIERLRNETDYTLPVSIIGSFAKRWGTSKEKVETVIKNYDLFLVEENYFFSKRLKTSMNIKSEKARISASYRWNNATASDRIANGMQKDAKEKKEKERKENRRGVKFSADMKKVLFSDGSSQKLGESQLMELERGSLTPKSVFKGNIY